VLIFESRPDKPRPLTSRAQGRRASSENDRLARITLNLTVRINASFHKHRGECRHDFSKNRSTICGTVWRRSFLSKSERKTGEREIEKSPLNFKKYELSEASRESAKERNV